MGLLMAAHSFVIKGDIVWPESPQSINTAENGYLVCENGLCAGVFVTLPDQFAALPLLDYSGKIVAPALVDLHIHAPQFPFRALGMDMELLDWLEKHAFPEEAKFADTAYARRAYGMLIEEIKNGAASRFCFFATLHTASTLLLMDMLAEAGLAGYVGRVNMDRNSPDYLREPDAESALAAVREWLQKYPAGGQKKIKPILTPRFIPSCSDELMKGLASLKNEFDLPVQSHLSENKKEIAWVKELCPSSGGYGKAYDDFGLLGPRTIMAHCVWSDDGETELLARTGTFIAHCPQSNINLCSGAAPVRRFLDKGINVGLGTDIAGGYSASIFRAMADAISVSKLRRAIIPGAENEKPLTAAEAFYLGTEGGGKFFGSVGSFKKGFEFDAIVIDDSGFSPPFHLSIADRLERIIYLSDDRHITAKFVQGKKIK